MHLSFLFVQQGKNLAPLQDTASKVYFSSHALLISLRVGRNLSTEIFTIYSLQLGNPVTELIKQRKRKIWLHRPCNFQICLKLQLSSVRVVVLRVQHQHCHLELSGL